MPIPSQAEYESREAQRFFDDLRGIERDWRTLSASERREEEQQFLDALRDPSLIAERVGWLLDGSYGYGSYRHALRTLLNKRMNRAAWMVQTVATLEWRVPQDVAIRTWKKLSAPEKQALAVAIEHELSDPEKIEAARGFEPSSVANRADHWPSNVSTERLRADLRDRQSEFRRSGGRGVDLAEEIDAIRAELASRRQHRSKTSANRARGGAPRHDDRSLDERYTFAREYTGHPSGKPQYVARFMREWIGSGSSLSEAHALARSHQRSRLGYENESNRARGTMNRARGGLTKATPVATLASLGVGYDPSAFYSVKGGKLYARERVFRKVGRGGLGKAKQVGTIPGFKRGVFYSVKNGTVFARRRK